MAGSPGPSATYPASMGWHCDQTTSTLARKSRKNGRGATSTAAISSGVVAWRSFSATHAGLATALTNPTFARRRSTRRTAAHDATTNRGCASREAVATMAWTSRLFRQQVHVAG
jgi:hypothetical protein